MRRMRMAALPIVPLVAAVASCGGGASSPPAPAPPATAAEHASATRDAPAVTAPEAAEPGPEASADRPASPPAEPAAGAPRRMPSAAPQAERLGTLPAGVGIAVGTQAPDAMVEDADGKAVRLHDLLDRGLVALVFYRGGWCPFCNHQIHALTTAWPELQRRGVTPVAISVDRVDEASKTRATYDIPFPVLADPDLRAHTAFGVVHRADDAEVERLKSFGLDIERASGKTHHAFAVPAIFIVDQARVVRWAHADADYKVRPTTEQLLAAIDGLGLAPAP